MDTPQALQHDYCFYFGVNMPVDLPRSERRKTEPAQRLMQYAINKGVGELDDRDIQAVQDERLKLAPRVSYRVAHTDGTSNGWTDMQREVDGVSGRDSIISIDHTTYRAAMDKTRSPVANAWAALMLAGVMIHEAAHVAHHHLMGNKCEDCREMSLITEAGFELEARIVGARLERGGLFKSWQSRHALLLLSMADDDVDCRHSTQIRDDGHIFGMKDSYVLKLGDDDFWSGEYVRRGAKALIPRAIAQSCRDQRDRYMRKPGLLRAHTKIPVIIRDLYRSWGPSYAKTMYENCWNPDLILRSEQAGPLQESDVVSSGEDSSASSGSDLFTSGEEQHTSDESSDDEDGDGAEGVVEEEEDGDDVEEDGDDVDEDAMSVDEEGSVVDEDQSVVDADDMDVDEDEDEDEAPPPPPNKGKASTKKTGSKRVRENSDDGEEAPAPKKTKNPTKKSSR
jgi:hypothetical protein